MNAEVLAKQDEAIAFFEDMDGFVDVGESGFVESLDLIETRLTNEKLQEALKFPNLKYPNS